MHYLNPAKENAWVVLFYRNFAGNSWSSHTGLGVSCLMTAAVLRSQRVRVDIFGVWNAAEIITRLKSMPGVTHVVVEAPWVPAATFGQLMQQFPSIHFLCRCHSQFGFLQVEAGAIKMIRDYLILQDSSLNFGFAGNADAFCTDVRQVYNSRCLYLPNLYLDNRPTQKHLGAPHKLMRAGSFGALRLLKNHTTAAAAAMTAAKSRGCDLEFHLSINREENGKGVLQAIRNMLAGVPWAKLVEVPWKPWPEFRHVVANMDLCFQLSFTETFNVVTADACAEGVPSVVSSAIDWLPRHWQADADDADDAARIANNLLWNPAAAREGLACLHSYVQRGTKRWLDYLDGNPMAA